MLNLIDNNLVNNAQQDAQRINEDIERARLAREAWNAKFITGTREIQIVLVENLLSYDNQFNYNALNIAEPTTEEISKLLNKFNNLNDEEKNNTIKSIKDILNIALKLYFLHGSIKSVELIVNECAIYGNRLYYNRK